MAGMGHTNHWVITAEELGATGASTQQAAAPSTETAQANQSGTTDLSPGAIEQMVERVMDKKLAPLKAQMADPAWGLRDIVAGIGYILGLMGLATYMHHRKT